MLNRASSAGGMPSASPHRKSSASSFTGDGGPARNGAWRKGQQSPRPYGGVTGDGTAATGSRGARGARTVRGGAGENGGAGGIKALLNYEKETTSDVRAVGGASCNADDAADDFQLFLVSCRRIMSLVPSTSSTAPPATPSSIFSEKLLVTPTEYISPPNDRKRTPELLAKVWRNREQSSSSADEAQREECLRGILQEMFSVLPALASVSPSSVPVKLRAEMAKVLCQIGTLLRAADRVLLLLVLGCLALLLSCEPDVAEAVDAPKTDPPTAEASAEPSAAGQTAASDPVPLLLAASPPSAVAFVHILAAALSSPSVASRPSSASSSTSSSCSRDGARSRNDQRTSVNGQVDLIREEAIDGDDQQTMLSRSAPAGSLLTHLDGLRRRRRRRASGDGGGTVHDSKGCDEGRRTSSPSCVDEVMSSSGGIAVEMPSDAKNLRGKSLGSCPFVEAPCSSVPDAAPASSSCGDAAALSPELSPQSLMKRRRKPCHKIPPSLPSMHISSSSASPTAADAGSLFRGGATFDANCEESESFQKSVEGEGSEREVRQSLNFKNCSSVQVDEETGRAAGDLSTPQIYSSNEVTSSLPLRPDKPSFADDLMRVMTVVRRDLAATKPPTSSMEVCCGAEVEKLLLGAVRHSVAMIARNPRIADKVPFEHRKTTAAEATSATELGNEEDSKDERLKVALSRLCGKFLSAIFEATSCLIWSDMEACLEYPRSPNEEKIGFHRRKLSDVSCWIQFVDLLAADPAVLWTAAGHPDDGPCAARLPLAENGDRVSRHDVNCDGIALCELSLDCTRIASEGGAGDERESFAERLKSMQSLESFAPIADIKSNLRGSKTVLYLGLRCVLRSALASFCNETAFVSSGLIQEERIALRLPIADLVAKVMNLCATLAGQSASWSLAFVTSAPQTSPLRKWRWGEEVLNTTFCDDILEALQVPSFEFRLNFDIRATTLGVLLNAAEHSTAVRERMVRHSMPVTRGMHKVVLDSAPSATTTAATRNGAAAVYDAKEERAHKEKHRNSHFALNWCRDLTSAEVVVSEVSGMQADNDVECRRPMLEILCASFVVMEEEYEKRAEKLLTTCMDIIVKSGDAVDTSKSIGDSGDAGLQSGEVPHPDGAAAGSSRPSMTVSALQPGEAMEAHLLLSSLAAAIGQLALNSAENIRFVESVIGDLGKLLEILRLYLVFQQRAGILKFKTLVSLHRVMKLLKLRRPFDAQPHPHLLLREHSECCLNEGSQRVHETTSRGLDEQINKQAVGEFFTPKMKQPVNSARLSPTPTSGSRSEPPDSARKPLLSCEGNEVAAVDVLIKEEGPEDDDEGGFERTGPRRLTPSSSSIPLSVLSSSTATTSRRMKSVASRRWLHLKNQMMDDDEDHQAQHRHPTMTASVAGSSDEIEAAATTPPAAGDPGWCQQHERKSFSGSTDSNALAAAEEGDNSESFRRSAARQTARKSMLIGTVIPPAAARQQLKPAEECGGGSAGGAGGPESCETICRKTSAATYSSVVKGDLSSGKVVDAFPLLKRKGRVKAPPL